MGAARASWSSLGPLGLVVAVLLAAVGAWGQTTWTKYENNPVLERGAPGEWDDGIADISAVYFDGAACHLWYGGGRDTEWKTAIGYATSPEGVTLTVTDTETGQQRIYTSTAGDPFAPIGFTCHPEAARERGEGSPPVGEDPFPCIRSGQALASLVGMTGFWERSPPCAHCRRAETVPKPDSLPRMCLRIREERVPRWPDHVRSRRGHR